jgi:hypothetical protein
MYEGKQPFYIITSFVAVILVFGIVVLYLLSDDTTSVLTGLSVQDELSYQGTLDAQPSLVSLGSKRVLYNPHVPVVDVEYGQEFMVGPYLVEVTHVKTMSKIGSFISANDFVGKEAELLFYVVQTYITNTGHKEGYTPEDFLTLTDGEYEYFLDNEGTKYLFERGLYYPVLRTGLKRLVSVAFDVERNDYWLLIHGEEQDYRVKLDV